MTHFPGKDSGRVEDLTRKEKLTQITIFFSLHCPDDDDCLNE
jgi:hypothetical protein